MNGQVGSEAHSLRKVGSWLRKLFGGRRLCALKMQRQNWKWPVEANKFGDRRRDLLNGNGLWNARSFWQSTRKPKQERDSDLLQVEAIAMTKEVALAERFTVIGGNHNQEVAFQTAFGKALEEFPQLGIQVSDTGIVAILSPASQVR